MSREYEDLTDPLLMSLIQNMERRLKALETDKADRERSDLRHMATLSNKVIELPKQSGVK